MLLGVFGGRLLLEAEFYVYQVTDLQTLVGLMGRLIGGIGGGIWKWEFLVVGKPKPSSWGTFSPLEGSYYEGFCKGLRVRMEIGGLDGDFGGENDGSQDFEGFMVEKMG